MHIKNIKQINNSSLSNWAKEQVKDKYEKAIKNKASSVPANRKSNTVLAKELPLEIYEGQKFTSSVRVFIHSIRNKLPDIDNLSSKCVIDAIVSCGILPDDRPEWIPEKINHTVEIGEIEETMIIIEEV